MDFWNIVLLMIIIVPALWVASIIIQVTVGLIILTIGAVVHGILWINKKVKGEA